MVNMSDHKIHIVGAGISGLVAAKVFEDHGLYPVVLESTDKVGGRVKTDVYKGYQLDHGFQVLLTAYPAANKYLNLKALLLTDILPGATIFKAGKKSVLGDPLREISLLLPTLTSGVGNLKDKLAILKLNRKLRAKSLEDIFSDNEISTLSYLRKLGFSSSIIDQFFKPFFSGIFLEPDLITSSRMFEFVYKMFGEGYAALPKSGIEAIPKQLAQKLKNTTFKFDTKVISIKDGQIDLFSNKKLESHFTIMATNTGNLIPNLKDQSMLL